MTDDSHDPGAAVGTTDLYSRRAVLRRTAVTVGGVAAATGCLSASDDVQSTTHIHREATADVPIPNEEPATGSSDSDEYVLQEGGVRWDSVPVETAVGIGTVPDGVSAAAAREALTAAFDAWNSVLDGGAVFASPTFDDSLTEITDGNGENEFVWSSLDDGTLGRATIYWDGETRRLEEVDIRLNREVSWSTGSEATDAFDVQSLATHEIGHHGLDDLTDPSAAEQTMYHETASGSTKKRTLEAGDVAGWREVYGDVV